MSRENPRKRTPKVLITGRGSLLCRHCHKPKHSREAIHCLTCSNVKWGMRDVDRKAHASFGDGETRPRIGKPKSQTRPQPRNL